jgi:hypothetical protein
MSYDSVYQLAQARHLEPMNEWHPPLMAMVWRFFDFFLSGPLPMLVLQSGLFLVGMYGLLRRAMPDRIAAIVTALMMVAPQNIIVMAVIWKDSQMAGFLLAAIAALQSEKRGWRIAGFVCLFLATAMRYNAAAATLPIFIAFARRRWWVAVAMWLAITIAAFGANRVFVEKKLYPFQTATAPVDVVGILRYAGHMEDEQVLALTPGVPWHFHDKLKVHINLTYLPQNTFLDVAQNGPYQLFEYPVSDADRAAFAGAWLRLIKKYPLAFVRHRLRMFRAQLDVNTGVWSGATNADWGTDWVQHDSPHAPMQESWISEMNELAPTKLFHPGFYFVLALALLRFAWRNRLAFMLLASGILYELGLLALAPATDYRYSQWMVCTTLLAIAVLVASRTRKGAAKTTALVPDTPSAHRDRDDDLRDVEQKDVSGARPDDDVGGEVHRHAGVDAGLKDTE